jgi:hypothetical protein
LPAAAVFAQRIAEKHLFLVWHGSCLKLAGA